MYSASVVLKAISDCSLLDHSTGQEKYLTTKPVLDVTDAGVLSSSVFQLPAKYAYTKQSKVDLVCLV